MEANQITKIDCKLQGLQTVGNFIYCQKVVFTSCELNKWVKEEDEEI
jgi:hypothetical protein